MCPHPATGHNRVDIQPVFPFCRISLPPQGVLLNPSKRLAFETQWLTAPEGSGMTSGRTEQLPEEEERIRLNRTAAWIDQIANASAIALSEVQSPYFISRISIAVIA